MLPMQSLKRCAVLLASLAALTGCAKTASHVLIADQLCKDWQHQQIRKADALTEATAAGIEALNKSRPHWGCQYGENRAAS